MPSWILDIPLRLKFLAIPLVAICCLIAILTFNLWVSRDGDEHLDEVKRSELPVLELVARNAAAVGSLRETVLAAVREDQPAMPFVAEQLQREIQVRLLEINRLAPYLRRQVEEVQRALAAFVSAGRAALLEETMRDNPFFAGNDALTQRSEVLLLGQEQLLTAAYSRINGTLAQTRERIYWGWFLSLMVTIGLIFMLFVLTQALSNGVLRALGYAIQRSGEIAQGILDIPVQSRGKDELSALLRAIEDMRASLKRRADIDAEREEEQAWAARLSEAMRGDLTPAELGRRLLACFSNALGFRLGALYLHQAGELRLCSTYAFSPREDSRERFRIGEGLLGQAAAQRTVMSLQDLPTDYLPLESGLGDTGAHAVVLLPIEHDGRLLGMFELGAIGRIDDRVLRFLERMTPSLGISLQSALTRLQLADNAETLRQQQQELHNRQNQLEDTNRVLEERTSRLIASEAKLREQQEELRAANEELQEKASLMTAQARELAATNKVLRETGDSLEEKARQLELSNQYKSQFLSTVSHELRTPLNSILILSSILAENPGQNLMPKQIEQLGVIHSAGNDLLNLINDILDMSKIEEGKLRTVREPVELELVRLKIERMFQHVAEERGLTLEIRVDEDVPDIVFSDMQRLEQILRNLLSNAFKFTEQGGVVLAIDRRVEPGDVAAVGFRVTDTGIGIAADKQQQIFEAFQQAEGSISRRFGGTGLGLSISRDLATALGGRVELVGSAPGEGSVFEVVLPIGTEADIDLEPALPARGNRAGAESADTASSTIEADAAAARRQRAYEENARIIVPGSEVTDGVDELRLSLAGCTLMLVDDDMRNLFSLTSVLEGAGAEVCATTSGKDCLVRLQEGLQPDVVLMDVMMPQLDGIETTRLLREEAGCVAPLIMITAKTDADLRERCIRAGADDFMAKPVRIDELLESVLDWWKNGRDEDVTESKRQV